MNHTTRYFFLFTFFMTSLLPMDFISHLLPEISNIIRLLTPLKDRLALLKTSKKWYMFCKKDLEKAIKEKAKCEAFKFIYDSNRNLDLLPEFPAFSEELIKLYEDLYARFVFFYGEWEDETYYELHEEIYKKLAENKEVFITPNYYFSRINDDLNNCESFLSLINKNDHQKHYTIAICKEDFSSDDIPKFFEYITKQNKTIQRIFFKSSTLDTLLNTTEKISTFLECIKNSGYRGIITTQCAGPIIFFFNGSRTNHMLMDSKRFEFLLRSNSTYTKYRVQCLNQYTPLDYLLKYGNPQTELVQLLLNYGTDPNNQDNNHKRTSLQHLIVRSNSNNISELKPIIKLLLTHEKHPVNPNIQDKYEKTALAYCREKTPKTPDIEDLLIKYMNPNHPDVKTVMTERLGKEIK